jgi:hypothetical protein
MLGLWRKERAMEGEITGKALKAALGEDLEKLLDEVAEVMNRARPGKIIADSEEGVRDAAAEFRRRLYEKALELRQQKAEAFSPSAASALAQQRAAANDVSDGQRPHPDQPQGVLEPRRRLHGAR